MNMYTFHINILFYIYLKALKQIAQNTYMLITKAKYHEAGGKWDCQMILEPYIKSSPPFSSIKVILWSRFFYRFLNKQHAGITPKNHAYGNLTLLKKKKKDCLWPQS